MSLITESQSYKPMQPTVKLNPHATKICNRLEHNFQIANKKALFYNMQDFYLSLGKKVENFLPLTFHIRYGTTDKVFEQFEQRFSEEQK